MAVQWLGCCVSNVGDKGLIHGQGIKTSHAVLCIQKKFLIKKKSVHHCYSVPLQHCVLSLQTWLTLFDPIDRS